MPTYVRDGDVWKAVSTSGSSSNVPAGTIIYFAATSAPTGYIKANGASLSTATYASLFAAIEYTFGGSGSSFTLPDLRGQFIRSWADNGTTYDAGRAFGLTQSSMVGPHNHVFQYGPSSWTVTGGPSTVNANRDGTGTTSNNTGTETRPRNIALLACIKY